MHVKCTVQLYLLHGLSFQEASTASYKLDSYSNYTLA